MQRPTTTLLFLLVLALGGTTVVLLRGQRELEDRVAELEKRGAPTARSSAVAPAPSGRGGEEAWVAPPETTAPRPSEAGRTAPVPAPRPAAAPSEPLSASVRDAVAREVERQLKDRTPLGVHSFRRDDPLTLMERELGLSPAQRERVAEVWRRRQLELARAWGGGDSDPARTRRDAEARYDLELKRELDFAQQQKYDELRREGKLQGGNFVIQVGVDRNGAERK